MKKYWKLILLVVVICFTFILYMYDLKAPFNKMPNYAIQTIDGDASLIDDITVTGYIHEAKEGGTYTEFRLQDDKLEKFENLPFYKRLENTYAPLEFEQLRKDYRQFMRKKALHDFYVENDTHIAFVDHVFKFGMYTYTKLQLDVMDKQTEERSTFEVDVKDFVKLSDLNIESIQMVGKQIYVTISEYKYDEENEGAEGYEYHLLMIDLDKQTVVDTEKLISVYDEEYWNSNYEVIHLTDEENEDNAMIGIVKVGEEYITDDIVSYEEEKEPEVVYLRYITADTTDEQELKLNKFAGEPVALFNDILLFAKRTNDGTHLEKVNIFTGETIATKELEGIYLNGYRPFISEEEVIYFFSTQDPNWDDTQIIALTTDTMELVYHGEVTADGKKQDYYHLGIQALETIQ